MYLSKEKRNVSALLFEFNKLPLNKKLEFLTEHGILLDEDKENDKLIHLYFVQGFFAEKVICATTEVVVEVIPYRNGYRVYQFLN